VASASVTLVGRVPSATSRSQPVQEIALGMEPATPASANVTLDGKQKTAAYTIQIYLATIPIPAQQFQEWPRFFREE